jgi:hypothetical protein
MSFSEKFALVEVLSPYLKGKSLPIYIPVASKAREE